MFEPFPFVRYTFTLVAGILIGHQLPLLSNGYWWLGGGVLILLGGIGALLTHARKKTVKALLSCSILLLGVLSCHLAKKQFSDRLHALDYPYTSYQVQVESLPEKRGKSIRFEASVQRLYGEGQWRTVRSRALLYLPVQAEAVPKSGDILLVKGILLRPPQSIVPLEFDYSDYLEKKGIPWIGYIRSGNFQIVPGPVRSFQPSRWPFRVSDWADGVFRKAIPDDDAYGLIKAMLLGRRDDIRSELNDAFISSGAVHVLSVSGLHVGIFFIFLTWMLGFLRKHRAGKYIYLVLLVFAMGFYSLMTGLPPSVQRAAIMSLVWVIADTFSRRHQPLNTLCIAAFLILLADPYVLWDVGFQLSFLAMLGIFLFTEPIALLYTPETRLVRHLWQVTAMSLAAQLMTFPVSIYYFHQFPTYFLFTNLLVIDIATILLPAAFTLLLLGMFQWEFLAGLAGKIVNFLSILTNEIVQLPSKLPGYLIENRYLDGFQTALLLLILLSAWGIIRYRNRRAVSGVFLFAVLFAGYSSCSDWLLLSKPVLSSYHLRGEKIHLLKVKNKVYIITNESIKSDTLLYERHLKNYISSLGSDTLWVANTLAAEQD